MNIFLAADAPGLARSASHAAPCTTSRGFVGYHAWYHSSRGALASHTSTSVYLAIYCQRSSKQAPTLHALRCIVPRLAPPAAALVHFATPAAVFAVKKLP